MSKIATLAAFDDGLSGRGIDRHLEVGYLGLGSADRPSGTADNDASDHEDDCSSHGKPSLAIPTVTSLE